MGSQSAKEVPYKCRYSKKTPRLPKGKLSGRKGSHLERLANAREARDIAKIVGCADDPIQRFNDCMFFLPFSALAR
jgi:hypothetical protein